MLVRVSMTFTSSGEWVRQLTATVISRSWHCLPSWGRGVGSDPSKYGYHGGVEYVMRDV